MMKDFFLVPPSMPTQRWREAFPEARFFHERSALSGPADGDVIWLAAELPDWRGELARLRRAFPRCALVLLSLQPDPNEGLTALGLGARGYCHALAAPSLLREVGEVLRHGGLWVGAELLERLVRSLRPHLGKDADPDGRGPQVRLSGREAEVARLVAAGWSNKEVARELDITERTVKAHLSAVFDKLAVRDRLQLVLRYGKTRRTTAEA